MQKPSLSTIDTDWSSITTKLSSLGKRNSISIHIIPDGSFIGLSHVVLFYMFDFVYGIGTELSRLIITALQRSQGVSFLCVLSTIFINRAIKCAKVERFAKKGFLLSGCKLF